MEMDTVKMKQIKFSALLMVVTVAIPVLTKNFVQNASVSMEILGMISICLLEMVTVRMEQIVLIVTMTEGIVVVHALLQATAQIVLALEISLAMKLLIKHLEMESVMTKRTMLPVILTMVTAV